MLRALNAWLPADVAVLALSDVQPDFDPRRDAVSRHYRYLIETRAVRSPLQRLRAWHVRAELDLGAMRDGAARLPGRHDFAAFASRLEQPGRSTVRELMRFDVEKQGTLVSCDTVANAFLPHQVRRMVGALVEVGRGKLGPAAYGALLDGPPASAGPGAPPHGLYLVRVAYSGALFATLDSAE
jgi:tRNA pseudouridine38-40 synthase